MSETSALKRCLFCPSNESHCVLRHQYVWKQPYLSTEVETQATLHEEMLLCLKTCRHTSTNSCKCWYTNTLSHHQSTHDKTNKGGLEHLHEAIYQMFISKWFVYVFTQWLKLMRKHVNISPKWAGSDSRLITALPRPPTNSVLHKD